MPVEISKTWALIDRDDTIKHTEETRDELVEFAHEHDYDLDRYDVIALPNNTPGPIL